MKKAQTWIFDYIVGFLIFAFLMFLSLSLLRSIDSKSDYSLVNREADISATSLLSPGFPENWNSSVVVVPGLTSNNRINISKIEMLDSFDYGRLKSLLQLTGEIWFYFKNSSGLIEINGACVRGFTYDGCSVPEVSSYYKDVAWVERIVVLNSEIVSMVVVVWR